MYKARRNISLKAESAGGDVELFIEADAENSSKQTHTQKQFKPESFARFHRLIEKRFIYIETTSFPSSVPINLSNYLYLLILLCDVLFLTHVNMFFASSHHNVRRDAIPFRKTRRQQHCQIGSQNLLNLIGSSKCDTWKRIAIVNTSLHVFQSVLFPVKHYQLTCYSWMFGPRDHRQNDLTSKLCISIPSPEIILLVL